MYFGELVATLEACMSLTQNQTVESIYFYTWAEKHLGNLVKNTTVG